MKDIQDWTGLSSYCIVKRAAEERENLREIVHNFRYDVDRRRETMGVFVDGKLMVVNLR